LILGRYSEARLGQDFEFYKFSGNADVWLKMKFDQDLRLNLRYDFGKMNSTLGSVVPLAMFDTIAHNSGVILFLNRCTF